MEESIDFALLKNRQTKRSFKRLLPVPEEEGTLEIQNQRCVFYLCGKALDVYELETSGFADWIDVVADKFPRCLSVLGMLQPSRLLNRNFPVTASTGCCSLC